MRGFEVGLAKAEVSDRGFGVGKRQPQDLRDGSEDRGVHDRQGLRSQPVVHGDRRCVDGRHVASGKDVREGLRRQRAVEHDASLGVHPLGRFRRDESGVQHDHVARLADGIVLGDLLVVDAHVRLDRRAGALRAVAAEGLHVLAVQEVGGRDQFGQRHAAASAAAVDRDLDHRGPSFARRRGGGSSWAATYSPYQAMAARARTAATGE